MKSIKLIMFTSLFLIANQAFAILVSTANAGCLNTSIVKAKSATVLEKAVLSKTVLVCSKTANSVLKRVAQHTHLKNSVLAKSYNIKIAK